METDLRISLRRQLENRRARLRDAMSHQNATGELVDLLASVDSALDRMHGESYGQCVICEESVGEEELATNPLLEYCLCGLTPQQQRALEHDLGLARRLQAALLPDPDLQACGWDTHHRYEPAGAVSGDFCDLWVPPGDDGTLFFAVADVSGKGVAASLLMTHIHAAFRSLLGSGVRLRDLVSRVNQQLLDARLPTHYATLTCGRARSDGRIELVNAGHCPPLIVRGNRVDALEPNGIPVGLLEDQPYDMTEFHLKEGEALVLHTDGLTEAGVTGDEEYGSSRLARILSSSPPNDARGIVSSVRSDLAEFLGGTRPEDDLTVMALVRKKVD